MEGRFFGLGEKPDSEVWEGGGEEDGVDDAFVAGGQGKSEEVC